MNINSAIDKKNKGSEDVTIPSKKNNKHLFKQWIKALRVHQWSKNLLLFLALFMSHRFLEINLVIRSIIAFFSFSLTASAVYILNDLCDLEADKKHPTKKYRPFASGQLSIVSGSIAIPILLSVSFLLSIIFLPKIFTAILIVYLIVTTAYSLYLKEILIVDVLVLGTLYALRVLAGGLALGINVSSWLLGFSWFFFLSLAFMKRYTDLIQINSRDQEELFGRGYSVANMGFVQKTGIISGIISLLVLVLYINSEQVLELYNQPILIWIVIPVILYWLMRMWFVANKGKMNDDPIIFAFRDKISYMAFMIIVVVLIAATNF